MNQKGVTLLEYASHPRSIHHLLHQPLKFSSDS